MPNIQHRTYKSYAGFLIRGSTPVSPPDNTDLHMEMAFYLLAQMEASKWGTVQSYDGAGMSAGPLHAIAYLRGSKQQGALWELVSEMIEASPTIPGSVQMRKWLKEHGMHLTIEGKVVYLHSARTVPGEDLRTLLSGPAGYAREDHEPAREAALLFHTLFSDPNTFRTQKNYTIKWLLEGQQDLELAAYTKYSATRVTPLNMRNFLTYATQPDLGVALHLAMCVYHAFSVNAPAPAALELRRAMAAVPAANSYLFAKTLIRGLGTRSYGRWKDTTDNTSRYDKTRLTLGKMKAWPAPFLEELMPENL